MALAGFWRLTPGLLALATIASCASARRAPSALQSCEQIAGATIPANAFTLPTRGARITSAVAVAAAPRTSTIDETILEIGAHCRVQGEIQGVSDGAPPIHFNVNLPERWNGKALQSGGGGLGGAVITAPGQKASGNFDPEPLYKPYPLTRGYVTFGSDEGHVRGDLTFMKNREAMENWGGNYILKARDAAFYVIGRAYRAQPTRLYFNGESAGGREALYAIQKFAKYYDGAIAVSPVVSWASIHIADNITRSRLIDGFVDAPAIKVIADAVRATCDAADGLKDGVIARYMECKVPPASVRCKDGKAAAGCLSDAQIATWISHTDRQDWPFELANGVKHFPGYSITGDEDGARYQYNFYPFGTAPPSRPPPAGSGAEPGRGTIVNFAVQLMRYEITDDPNFDPYNFDIAKYEKELKTQSAMFDATDPDLSPLAARGGKVIVLQPSADNAAATPMVAEYYRSVVKKMGASGAGNVVRFYVGPGGGHNVTGISQIELLPLLEAWVEHGKAPPMQLTAENVDPKTLAVTRSMPACHYPAYARYVSGDPNKAASFKCTNRPDPLGPMQ